MCAVDDANDHILSVWNWQKEKQLAEVKVPQRFIVQSCVGATIRSERSLFSSRFLSLQCSNDSVLAAVFHPMDDNLIVTCGKSHINFWTIDSNTLVKKQGLFEVTIAAPGHGVMVYLGASELTSVPASVALETREAKVRVVCGVRREWRRHHRRLQWKHLHLGQRLTLNQSDNSNI